MEGQLFPKEGKEELGLDHDEVRRRRKASSPGSAAGWEEAPALSVRQVRRLLSATLPAEQRDATALLAPIQEVQRRHYAAVRARRRRRLRPLQGADTS